MRLVWLAALVASALALPAAAKPPTPLFASNELIHFTLKGPIASLAKGSATDGVTVEGTLSVDGAVPETLPVILSARGITRRKHETCSFPPLLVKFATKPGKESLFKGQNKLKLVTHCRPASGFQQYLLLEYAAYRMANVLSPASFDVRLATVDYVDAEGKPMTTRLGFFLEDASDMAKRNDLVEFKTKERIGVSRLDARAAARLTVFEYMIGNLDWAMTAGAPGLTCCHNSRPIGAPGATTGLLPIPYDFDFSGMVDAPYAAPPNEIKLPNVRVRRYRGYCRHNVEAQAVAAEIYAKRSALLAVLSDIPQLEERSRTKATAYLNGFFDQVATPAGVDDKLLKTCL